MEQTRWTAGIVAALLLGSTLASGVSQAMPGPGPTGGPERTGPAFQVLPWCDWWGGSVGICLHVYNYYDRPLVPQSVQTPNCAWQFRADDSHRGNWSGPNAAWSISPNEGEGGVAARDARGAEGCSLKVRYATEPGYTVDIGFDVHRNDTRINVDVSYTENCMVEVYSYGWDPMWWLPMVTFNCERPEGLGVGTESPERGVQTRTYTFDVPPGAWDTTPTPGAQSPTPGPTGSPATPATPTPARSLTPASASTPAAR